MTIASTARGERIRAEKAYKDHLAVCYDCFRQTKGQDTLYCDLGVELLKDVALMTEQERLLKEPEQPEWEQPALW